MSDNYFFITCYFLISEKFEAAKSEVVDESLCFCWFLRLQWLKTAIEEDLVLCLGEMWFSLSL